MIDLLESSINQSRRFNLASGVYGTPRGLPDNLDPTKRVCMTRISSFLRNCSREVSKSVLLLMLTNSSVLAPI